jgi:hypothetical protein
MWRNVVMKMAAKAQLMKAKMAAKWRQSASMKYQRQWRK